MKLIRAASAFAVLSAAALCASWQVGVLARAHNRPLPPRIQQDIPALSPAELCRLHVDESGLVPVLMYHDITQKERWLGRSVEHFRRDLERLYAERYRPVSVSEYVSNRMDLPAGCSPVILTFDDSRKSQFKYLQNGGLDPDCAVAIMNEFHERHPDFPRKAMFFVLPKCAFRQAGTDTFKLKLLQAWGYEIGNHTVTHANLSRLTDIQVQQEIAGCVRMVRERVPGTPIDSLAFPGGHMPANRSLSASGMADGIRYENRSAFLAANDPAPSPVSVKFRPMRIERVEACEGYAGVDYWLDRLKAGKIPKYVSDGDMRLVTTPAARARVVDRSRLLNCRFRQY